MIWEDKEGHIVTNLVFSHAQPVSIPVIRSYITASNDIAVASDSAEHLRFYLTVKASDSTGSDFIPVAPYKTETADNLYISYFKYRDMNDSLKRSGIDNAAKVESIMLVSDGPDMTVYEVDTVSLKPSVTYLLNGQSFTSEASATTLPGMKVLGWYTTKDFKEGTEFNGEAGRSITVYGKMIPEYDTAAMQLYTEKYGTDDITPTPQVTAAVDISPAVTDAPDLSITDIPATGKPERTDPDNTASSDNGEEPEKTSGIAPVTLIIVLAGLAAFIIALIFIMKKHKKEQN